MKRPIEGFVGEFHLPVDRGGAIQLPTYFPVDEQDTLCVWIAPPQFNDGLARLRVATPERCQTILEEGYRFLGYADVEACREALCVQVLQVRAGLTFILPDLLIQQVGITDEVVLIGMLLTFEIYPADAYRAARGAQTLSDEERELRDEVFRKFGL